MPSHGRISSSKTPQTAVAGCSRRCCRRSGCEAGAQQQRRRLDRAAGGDDRARRAPSTRCPRPCAPRRRAPRRSRRARARARADDDPRAGAGGVGEPGLHASTAWRRAGSRSRSSRRRRPGRSRARCAASRRRASRARSSPRRHQLVAPRGAVVVLVDAEPLADGVEARLVARSRTREPSAAHSARTSSGVRNEVV